METIINFSQGKLNKADQGCQKRFFDTTRNIQYKLGS
jgi:hypothetical protein